MADYTSNCTNFAKPSLDELETTMLTLPKNASGHGILMFHYFLLSCYADLCENYLFVSFTKIIYVLEKFEADNFHEKDRDFDSIMAELGEAIYEAGIFYGLVTTTTEAVDSYSILEDIISPHYNKYVEASERKGRKDRQSFIAAVNKQEIERYGKEFEKISVKNWPTDCVTARNALSNCYVKLLNDTNCVRSCHNEYLHIRKLVKENWEPLGVRHLERNANIVKGLEFINWYTLTAGSSSNNQLLFKSKEKRGKLQVNNYIKR